MVNKTNAQMNQINKQLDSLFKMLGNTDKEKQWTSINFERDSMSIKGKFGLFIFYNKFSTNSNKGCGKKSSLDFVPREVSHVQRN